MPPWRPGWRPADDDHSPTAVAWRADTAHRVARRAEEALGRLGEQVETLTRTISDWDAAWSARWHAAGRVARWAAALVGGAALVAGARELWSWLSTLHH